MSDIESESIIIASDSHSVSEEMKARFNFFEETVEPYEEKMKSDLDLRNQLLLKTCEWGK